MLCLPSLGTAGQLICTKEGLVGGGGREAPGGDTPSGRLPGPPRNGDGGRNIGRSGGRKGDNGNNGDRASAPAPSNGGNGGNGQRNGGGLRGPPPPGKSGDGGRVDPAPSNDEGF
ncbi:hypothetical protein BKA69DRAFT_1178754 [Paraphysoderma sedebokerense]|nr:hypothetical protein BKA69DRAFT_1178754 [Paraphysoderma sedebokerense]